MELKIAAAGIFFGKEELIKRKINQELSVRVKGYSGLSFNTAVTSKA